ncbi:MAG: asparagine synthetase B, partial [Bacteroidota bacterium]|nr:asparagine synthetase B [Bacteroidota bacterium]
KDKTGYETPQRAWMEQPVLQDYIHEARKALVAEQILKPGVLQKKIHPKEVHAAEKKESRYLVTAAFLKND